MLFVLLFIEFPVILIFIVGYGVAKEYGELYEMTPYSVTIPCVLWSSSLYLYGSRTEAHCYRALS